MKVKDIRSEVKTKARKAADTVGTMFEAGREKMSHIEVRPLWERVKAGFEKTASVIGKGTEKAAGNVVLTAKRTGLRYERFELERKLRKLAAQLGATVYDAQRTGAKSISFAAPAVKDLITEISGLEKKIEDLERRSRSLKKAA